MLCQTLSSVRLSSQLDSPLMPMAREAQFLVSIRCSCRVGKDLTATRWNKQAIGSSESCQPCPRIHRQWYRPQSEMELLRLQDQDLQWRLGTRASDPGLAPEP